MVSAYSNNDMDTLYLPLYTANVFYRDLSGISQDRIVGKIPTSYCDQLNYVV